MEKFVIEVIGNPRSYIERIGIAPDGNMSIRYTRDVEKAALFTENAAVLFAMEAANAGINLFWASSVKLGFRMVVAP